MWFILIEKEIFGNEKGSDFQTSTQARELLEKNGWNKSRHSDFRFERGGIEATVTPVKMMR